MAFINWYSTIKNFDTVLTQTTITLEFAERINCSFCQILSSFYFDKPLRSGDHPVPFFEWESLLTFWRQKYFFFLILAHSVYRMWIIEEPNTLELWNKLHFEEKKTESIYRV